MNRVERSFKITILPPSGILTTITPPFSVNFTITRNKMASANTCSLTIYNLAPQTRALLYKDRNKISEYWQIIIRAGYTGGITRFNFRVTEPPFSLPVVFQGNIQECSSQKKGNLWETTFDCFDSGYAIQNGFTAQTVSKGETIKQMIQSMMKDMPNMIEGAIRDFTGQKTDMRGRVLFGKSNDVISELSDDQLFFDNETAYVLANGEVVAGDVIVLDSSLLRTTPKRRETFLECDLNFFPEAKVGRICQLSSKEPRFDGQYDIVGFTHSVTIAGDQCGDASTQISLNAPLLGLTAV